MFRRLVAARTALALLAALAMPAAGQPDDTGAATALADELRLLYRTQAPSGALVFEGPLRFYERHPVMASFCLDSHRRRPDAALVSQTAAAVSRYYDHLLGERDHDRDLLVETTVTGPHGASVEAEEVGFNSLLALDMISLAQLYLEARNPYRALYWYVVARTIQDGVVYAGLDADAGYFFATRADNDQQLKQYRALAAAPLLFGSMLGDNHAGAIVREHLLKPVARVPESAFDFLGGPAPDWTDDATASSRLLKSLVMLRILESRGFFKDAAVFRDGLAARARADLMLLPDGVVASAHLAHLVELLEGTGAGSLHDGAVALELFNALIRATNVFDDNVLVRLQSSVSSLAQYVNQRESDATASDVNAAGRAVVDVYVAVSDAREKMETKSLFPSTAWRKAGGIDPARAFERVLDDVGAALRKADNRLFRHRFRETGLYVRATLLRDRAIAGSEIEVKWALGAHNRPVTVHDATVRVGAESSTLVASDQPLALAPGEAHTLSSRFTIDHGHVDTLLPITLTIDLDVGDGARARYHAERSVYLEHPVEVTAAFPQGRMLAGTTLPIDVIVTKKAQTAATVRYEWYSPTGLSPAEGRSAQYVMQTDEDSVSLRLNIPVPPTCRPGRFPFKLGFMANDVDLGLISSSLFRPYEWVFAGPFRATADPMAEEFPPENGVRVADVYGGPKGEIHWVITGDGVYDDRGEISLAGLLASPGVGFLHTAVKTEYDVTMPVFMSSTAPAELFVNGRPILQVDASQGAAPTYARAVLTSGVNSILIKVAGDRRTRLFFNLGDENDEPSYAFNNRLAEILDGYATLVRRSSGEDVVESDAQKLVTLRYHDPAARAVAVIGTFNGWSPDQSRMRRGADGSWEIVVSLPPGRYAYRFLIDERRQVLDPNGQDVEPDGFGGENSVMFVE